MIASNCSQKDLLFSGLGSQYWYKTFLSDLPTDKTDLPTDKTDLPTYKTDLPTDLSDFQIDVA